jgi:hypothetical protein
MRTEISWIWPRASRFGVAVCICVVVGCGRVGFDVVGTNGDGSSAEGDVGASDRASAVANGGNGGSPDGSAGNDGQGAPPDLAVPSDTAVGSTDAPRLAAGSPCTSPGQCQSYLCIDGVCCQTDCQGPCRSCNLAGSAGTCAPLPTGTTCGTQTCTGTTQASPGSCDGVGNCQPGATRDCAPYLCSGDRCAVACLGPTDCASGFICTASVCVMK